MIFRCKKSFPRPKKQNLINKVLPIADINMPRSCLRLIICFLGQENDLGSKEIIFMSTQNELSDVNKTYIVIGDVQKF